MEPSPCESLPHESLTDLQCFIKADIFSMFRTTRRPMRQLKNHIRIKILPPMPATEFHSLSRSSWPPTGDPPFGGDRFQPAATDRESRKYSVSSCMFTHPITRSKPIRSQRQKFTHKSLAARISSRMRGTWPRREGSAAKHSEILPFLLVVYARG